MDKKEIHLVRSFIGENGGLNYWHHYKGPFYTDECPYRVSSRDALGELTIPLWFGTEQAARDYVEKASSDTEREFYLIQEFSYHSEGIKDEAKIIFPVNSDTWPVLQEGKTERAPGIWAHVRSIFICDKAAAFDYVRRFNEDSEAAHSEASKNYHGEYGRVS